MSNYLGKLRDTVKQQNISGSRFKPSLEVLDAAVKGTHEKESKLQITGQVQRLVSRKLLGNSKGKLFD